MRSSLPAVAKQLFRDIKKIYEETSESKKRAIKADRAKSALERLLLRQEIRIEL